MKFFWACKYDLAAIAQTNTILYILNLEIHNYFLSKQEMAMSNYKNANENNCNY
jgi:hypothetical protein